MKRIHAILSFLVVSILAVAIFQGITAVVSADPSTPPEVPVKDMVTMVDLGANSCVPCKMMAPILQKLEREYTGRAAIVFLDVWKDPDQAKRFGIKVIPTQVFYDKEGKEVYRHVGFMSESAIVNQLKSMGVE
jgi:thioredoxin 1